LELFYYITHNYIP